MKPETTTGIFVPKMPGAAPGIAAQLFSRNFPEYLLRKRPAHKDGAVIAGAPGPYQEDHVLTALGL